MKKLLGITALVLTCIYSMQGASTGNGLGQTAPRMSVERLQNLPEETSAIYGSLFSPVAIESKQNSTGRLEIKAAGMKPGTFLTIPKGGWATFNANCKYVGITKPLNSDANDIETTIYELSGMRKVMFRKGVWAKPCISDDGEMIAFVGIHPMQRFVLEFYDAKGTLLKKDGPKGPDRWANWVFCGKAKRLLVVKNDGILRAYGGNGTEVATFDPQFSLSLANRCPLHANQEGTRIFLSPPIGSPGRESKGLLILDKDLKLVGVKTGEEVRANEIKFSPGGDSYVLTTPDIIELCDTESGTVLWRLQKEDLLSADGQHTAFIDFALGNKVAAVSIARTNPYTAEHLGERVYLISRSGEVLARNDFEAGADYVEDLEVSSDGSKLAWKIGSALEFYRIPGGTSR